MTDLERVLALLEPHRNVALTELCRSWTRLAQPHV